MPIQAPAKVTFAGVGSPANQGRTMRKIAFFLLLTLTACLAAAQSAPVDVARSKLTIHVEKSGLFSAFAHNHVIEAPIASGQLDTGKRSVTLAFNAKEMKVLDPGVKESEVAEIDQTMKSDKVLDVARFPEIRFVSTNITPQDGNRYQIRGDLSLHGVTKPVDLPVSFANGRYTGSIKMKQTDFGIAPVSIAGGTVKVKDVIEIVFEIVPGKN
jgi:polyisoprenoid-binding protein YceI